MNLLRKIEFLIDRGLIFRRTPIVDNDFVTIRNIFDACLRDTSECIKYRPKIITLCGSTRFKEAFEKANLEETLKGHIVLSVGVYHHSNESTNLTDEEKQKLDTLHKHKIDLSDEIFVLNVGGYIGNSTASEIQHAKKFNVKVRYLERV